MNRAKVSERRSEDLLLELLTAQGWDRRRPPRGDILRQHEYRSFPHLRVLLQKASKTGKGFGLPEAFIVDRSSQEPLAVIEAKSDFSDLDQAVSEARHYANPCIDAGYNPLAIGIAGTSDEEFGLRVEKWEKKTWIPITYDKTPINWIPNPNDLTRISIRTAPSELRPTIPPAEVLARRADEINRLLREARIKDEFRPAVVGSIMLALWSSGGDIRKAQDHILGDINKACKKAFWRAKKPDLADSLRVDEANDALAVKARRIVSILELLNVSTLTAEHDYLGQLYETFFRYTGGNTIGQYFTPRHVTEFMAEICDLGKKDTVLDPACGTGGFLISAMNRVLSTSKVSRLEMVKIVRKRLIGFEDEPVTAALCVANMILRGDGSTSVYRGNCFTSPQYPRGKATVGLMNPPFPHRKTDKPPFEFIDRLLEGLQQRGRLAAICPVSLTVKMSKQEKNWRRRLLRNNTLDAVIGLPDELFQPFAAANTVIIVLTCGIPHDYSRPVFFSRVENDGLRLRKGIRLPITGNKLPEVLSAFREKREIPDVCGMCKIAEDEEWSPGAYIPSQVRTGKEILDEAALLIRTKTAMLVKYAPRFKTILSLLESGKIEPRDYHEYSKREKPAGSHGTIGAHFEVFYGQNELETKRDLDDGDSLIISSTAAENGLYGFFDFDWLVQPPVITVPRTGSIGYAHVQEWPFGATSDCLILVPRDGVPLEYHYIAAAILRLERWRFNYGRKMTPPKIETFAMKTSKFIARKIGELLMEASEIERQVLGGSYDLRYEEVIDVEIAARRLKEIQSDPSSVVQEW